MGWDVNNFRSVVENPTVQSACLLVLFYLLFVEVIYRFIFVSVPKSVISLLVVFVGFFIITVVITRLLYPEGNILFNANISDDDSPFYIYLKHMTECTKKSAMEELKFRIVPYALMSTVLFLFTETIIVESVYYIIGIIATVIWVLMHKERFLIVMPSGVFFGVLLVNGMIIESLVIHIAYNNTLLTAGFARWFLSSQDWDVPL